VELLPEIEAQSSGEVGKFQLIARKVNTKNERLYRIDTQTGKVWEYLEEGSAIVTKEAAGKIGISGEQFEKIRKAKAGVMFTLPYWEETSEFPPKGTFTIDTKYPTP
jgi:hypothetical protein